MRQSAQPARLSLYGWARWRASGVEKVTVSRMAAVDTEQGAHRGELFINREIAAIAFIRRVLEEAQSDRHPLLERIKFLSFVSNQMDEFLVVRMAGLHDQLSASVRSHGPDGLTPAEEIQALRQLIGDLLREQRATYYDVILPRLNDAGIQTP